MNLNKINVQDLFRKNDGSRQRISGEINIENLFNKKIDKSEYSFDTTKLFEKIKLNKEKTEQAYKDILKICCEQIISSNNVGITDIIFEVPLTKIECVNYTSNECLRYIADNLKKSRIKSYIITDIKIFITWVHLME